MSEQPEALRLAETPFSLRDGRWNFNADDELRRLHALCEEMGEALEECVEDTDACIQQHIDQYGERYRADRLAAMQNQEQKARAALAKWKESK